MTKEKTCNERIDDRLKSRISDLESIDLDDPDLERMLAIFDDYGYPDSWTKEQLKDFAELDDREKQDLIDYANEKLELGRSEGVLSIDKEIVLDVCLSTGGPGDGFRIYYSPEHEEFTRGEYYFLDWYDGATRRLSNEELDQVVQAYALECYIGD